ncbi:hypothetical protein BH24CHL4_BH24CHL4_01180 [soil metagenome]
MSLVRYLYVLLFAVLLSAGGMMTVAAQDEEETEGYTPPVRAVSIYCVRPNSGHLDRSGGISCRSSPTGSIRIGAAGLLLLETAVAPTKA